MIGNRKKEAESKKDIALQIHSFTLYNVMFSFVNLFPFIADRFVRSFRDCHLEFNNETIYNGWRSQNGRYRWEFWI